MTRTLTNRQAVDKIMKSGHRIFSVLVKTRGGQLRIMNCRRGVKKGLKPHVENRNKFDPASRGLISVYDVQKKDYRFIATEGLKTLDIGGEHYKIR